MRNKRNLKLNVNEDSKEYQQEYNLLTSFKNPLNQQEKRKGRSTSKAYQPVSAIYQQKLILPKNEKGKSISKPTENDFAKLKQQEPIEVEIPKITNFSHIHFLTPVNRKQSTPGRRILKDCSPEKSQRISPQRRRSKARPDPSRVSNYSPLEIEEPRSYRFKKAQTFEIEERSYEQPTQTKRNLQKYYMDQLKQFLHGFNQDNWLAQFYLNHFIQQYHTLQICKTYQLPNIAEEQLIPQRISEQFQRTLVLDLDETLIHCNEVQNNKFDFKVPVQLINGMTFEAEINVRPFTQQFLQEASKYFEIIIFTASHKNYANKIIDQIDPLRKHISVRLFRENCYQSPHGMHIKDLRILNRNLKDLVLVDNAAYSYSFQVENGIPIIPFIDNREDKELIYLWEYLKTLVDVEDMREYNKNYFNFDKLQQCETIDQAIKVIV